MKAKSKPRVSRAIAAKAKQILEFAQSRAKTAGDWLELHFALYGTHGKASELFTTAAERAAFSRTSEHKQLLRLLDSLPQPKQKEIRQVVSVEPEQGSGIRSKRTAAGAS